MNFLLDTHAFIWFIFGDEKLPQGTANYIRNAENRCFISIASLWEIAIKVSLGKLDLPKTFDEVIDSAKLNQIEIFYIGFNHLIEVSKLPFHHKDPFDRLIISQAKIEDLTVITKDPHFSNYSIKIIWD